MFRNFINSKVLSVTLLMVMALLGGPIPHGSAGIEPPTEVERLAGPAIVATLTATWNAGLVTAMVTGDCKGQPVVINPDPFPRAVDFTGVTEAEIEDLRIGDAPAGCHSDFGGEDMIINTVLEFTNTGTTIVVRGVLLFVVPR